MQKYNLPRLFIWLAFVALSFTVSAQAINYVVLSKPGNTKRYTFMEGQDITYRVKGDIGFYTDRIVKVQDSAILFATYTLPFADIEKIFIKKKKHIVPNKTALTYGGSLLASAAILEVAYLVNTGAGMPTLGNDLVYMSTPIPLLLLANWVYSWFVKTEYTLSANEYQLRPVILRKD